MWQVFMLHPELRSVILGMACLCASLTVAAAEQIQIHADYMQLNINTGESIYQGNVSFVQGQVELSGSKITINSRDGEITQVQVEGEPARYRNTNVNGRVLAESERMDYVVSQNQLTMLGTARLEQDDRVVQSQRIIYDTNAQLIIAGKTSGSDNADVERVNITLTPRKDKVDP